MNDKIIWQIVRESFVPLQCVIGWSGHDRDLPTESRKVLGQLRDADGWGAATRRKLARYDQHLPQTASLSWVGHSRLVPDTDALLPAERTVKPTAWSSGVTLAACPLISCGALVTAAATRVPGRGPAPVRHSPARPPSDAVLRA